MNSLRNEKLYSCCGSYDLFYNEYSSATSSFHGISDISPCSRGFLSEKSAMKIPVYEEIILQGNGKEYLSDFIPLSRIGRVPSFINAQKLSRVELINFLDDLEEALAKNKLNSLFPYPLYVITEELAEYNSIPLLKTVKDLPDHFYKKIKRPNNKEMQLLNKLYLRVEKVGNLEMEKLVDNLKNIASEQKELYKISKELYFLEKLHDFYFPVQKEKVKRIRV